MTPVTEELGRAQRRRRVEVVRVTETIYNLRQARRTATPRVAITSEPS